MSPRISIICCYNNEEMYKRFVYKSLAKQKFKEYELIGINNAGGQYKKAADALNLAASKATTDILLFVHQDFEFLSSESLYLAYKAIATAGEYDVLGVAGALLNREANLCEVFIGRNRKVVSTLGEGNPIAQTKDLIQVETLDECCFGVYKSLWNRHPFNEKLCHAWDLYAVELCLYSKTKGGNSYVMPLECEHYSGGNLTSNFYKALRNIAKAYKKDIEKIITTCVVTTSAHPELEYYKLIFLNYLRKLRKVR